MKYPRLERPNIDGMHMDQSGSQGTGTTFIYPKQIFDEGRFLLTAPDAGTGVHHISPRFWSDTVQPSWTIELHLEDFILLEGEKLSAVEKAAMGVESSAPSTKLTRYWT
jgi:hypothetical protein